MKNLDMMCIASVICNKKLIHHTQKATTNQQKEKEEEKREKRLQAELEATQLVKDSVDAIHGFQTTIKNPPIATVVFTRVV